MALTLENLEEARARKAEQARINGRQSKGPTTIEGKHKSSQNSIRHGLTANEHTLLFGEVPEEYDEVYNCWVDKLRPADKAEMRLVEKYAYNDWRLERLAMMETCLLNMSTAREFDRVSGQFQRIDAIGHLVEAWRGNSSVSQCLDRVYRYTATLQRQSSTILRDFRDFEKRRLARELAGDNFDQPWQPVYKAPALETTLPSQVQPPETQEVQDEEPPATEQPQPQTDQPEAVVLTLIPGKTQLRNEPTLSSKTASLPPPKRPAA